MHTNTIKKETIDKIQENISGKLHDRKDLHRLTISQLNLMYIDLLVAAFPGSTKQQKCCA